MRLGIQGHLLAGHLDADVPDKPARSASYTVGGVSELVDRRDIVDVD